MNVIAYIPAYNEAGCVGEVVGRTLPYVTRVVLVDDGSTDETAEVARGQGAEVLAHSENLGKGAAIVSALEHFAGSDGTYAVFLDADGQHDPAEIESFTRAAQETGAGIVIGNRMRTPRDMPLVRRLTNWMMSWWISRLAGHQIPDTQCGYRLLGRGVLGKFEFKSHRFETETEMLIQAGRAGLPIVSIPIRTIYQAGRESHIQPGHDALRFLRLLWRYRK